MGSASPRILIAACALLALSACHRQPAATAAPMSHIAATTTESTGTETSVNAASAAPAGSANLPGDHTVTKHYKIAITLPTLPVVAASLAKALRATADAAKREFLQALPDPRQFPEFADRQLAMLLDFKVVATTPAFVSVSESGSEDTGGAHPIPVQSSFVYDRSARRVIVLDDLFADPAAARKALAGYAHEKLLARFMAQAPKTGEGSPAAIREWKTNMLQMLDAGTQPTADNYSVFIVRAGATETAPSPGLTLIFTPYQVAPYVYGTQTVAVPAGAFAKFLKPQYRSAFAAD